MTIKVLRKPTGIPFASVSTAPGVTDAGVSQVTAFILADNGPARDVVARLNLSTKEARDLAAQLIANADAADALTKAVRP